MATEAPAVAKPDVLVLEDDPTFRELLVGVLEAQGFGVRPARSVNAARRLLEKQSFDVAILDVHLGDGSGLELIEPIRAQAGAAQIVVMSAIEDPATIALALKRGAFEFVGKPVEPPRLVAVLERAAEKARLLRENEALRSAAAGGAAASVPFERLGEVMRGVAERIRRAAALDVPILIHGESGTGKEFVARAIHAASPRAQATWLPVNCGALKPELLDSELFGHEKGAFTGAADRRLGLVEVARGGTLFLDEISELPLEAQVSLLRFLEQREYRRVGGTEILTSDARILAATNRDLPQAVAQGRFREDLYFRLAVVTIRVPPLRERREDIGTFVRHFLALRAAPGSFSPEVLRALEQRDWKGNLRELRNAVDRLLLAGAPAEARVRDLDAERPRERVEGPVERSLAAVEREHIVRVLEHHRWNRTKAARTLEISVRTLYRKIREYDLEGR